MKHLSIKKKLAALLILPIIGMAILAIGSISMRFQEIQDARAVDDLVDLSEQIGDLVHEVQQERGASALYLGSEGTRFETELAGERSDTDRERAKLEELVDAFEIPGGDARIEQALRAAVADLEKLASHRERVGSVSLTPAQSNAYYTRLNAAMLDVIGFAAVRSSSARISSLLNSYGSLMLAKEQMGLERAVLSAAFSSDRFSPEMLRSSIATVTGQQNYLSDYRIRATPEQIAFYDQTVQGSAVAEVDRMRSLSRDRWDEGNFGTDPTHWFAMATDKIDLVKEVEDRLAADVLAASEETNRAALNALLFTVVVVLLLGALAAAGGYYIMTSIMHPVRELATAARQVQEGDLSASASVDQRDELGHLAGSFNEMVGTIREGQEDLKAEKASVERKVEEAVRESEAQQAYLSRSVQAMLDRMRRFAAGDLTVQVEPEREGDAIAELFDGFNEAVSNLREMLRQVGVAVEDTASATAEISSTTDQLASSAQEQSTQADEVAAAVEEMTRTIVENSESTRATAEAAEEGQQHAHEGGAVVEETVGKIRQIAEVVSTSADQVERLGASSKQIGEIVETIDEIAEQTNLLALNAAIEAARAGEQGRGFAVVADEVRKLAERTTLATQEIGSMIASVQEETGEAVRIMRNGTEHVEEGLRLADRTGEALAQIVGSTERIGDRVRHVASASEQQSATSEQISRSVQAISTVSQDSAAGVSQIATSAAGLERLTVDLRTLVEQFRLDEGPGKSADTALPSAPARESEAVRRDRVPAGDGHERGANRATVVPSSSW